MTHTLGLFTSGGDCAGLDAAIRGVVRRAGLGYGWRVVGIRDGLHGLLDRPYKVTELSPYEDDGDLLRGGGTVLGSASSGNPLYWPGPDGATDRSGEILSACATLGFDAIIGIGGDGSMRILDHLAQKGGLKIVTIPKTIDNDVPGTSSAIGFSSAVAVATDAMDRLYTTAASHKRVMLLEVMGRDAGFIALHAGIAGGADVILIPEIAVDLDKVASAIQGVRHRGVHHALVIVAEGVAIAGVGADADVRADGTRVYAGAGEAIGDGIAQRTGYEVKVNRLGHLQRGGSPNARDRVLASTLGAAAVDMVADGRFGEMVFWKGGEVHSRPIAEVTAEVQRVDPDGALVRGARGLGISLGD